MLTTRVLILEGPNGQSFFFKETLLGEGLAEQVDLTSRADQAIDLIHSAEPYDLIVINLVEAWEQGMRLGLWLSQQALPTATVLIISSELDRPIPAIGASMVLSEPVSLREFADCVRAVLDPTIDETNPVYIQKKSSSHLMGLPSWSGEPLHQEYAGSWSPFSSSFLS